MSSNNNSTSLTPREQEVLDLLRNNKHQTTDIARILKISQSRARNYINELRNKGYNIAMSQDRRNKYALYWLVTDDSSTMGNGSYMCNSTVPPTGVMTPDNTVIVNIPKVTVRDYKPMAAAEEGDPETQVLLLSDLHAGEITESYDTKTFKRRMDTLLESLLTITHLHREMYPIDNLVVIDLGDNVHGENPYQGAKIGSVECGAFDQVFKILMPTMVEFLSSLKQEFRTVSFYGVRGNHGRSKLAPETSNLDLMFYRALDSLTLPDGITIHYSEDFKIIAEVQGFRFFGFHGDQVHSLHGVPYIGLKNKLESWYHQYGGFNYSCCGHWHKSDTGWRVNRDVKHYFNGTLATDDPFSLERVGQSAIPSQVTFGVHERNGITWVYELVTDKRYLPQKMGRR